MLIASVTRKSQPRWVFLIPVDVLLRNSVLDVERDKRRRFRVAWWFQEKAQIQSPLPRGAEVRETSW